MIGNVDIQDSNNNPFGITEYNATDGAILRLKRARGISTAPSNLQTGDSIASIRGFGYNSNAFIKNVAIDMCAAENLYIGKQWYIHLFHNNCQQYKYVLRKMRLDPTGNLGIGTTTPNYTLDVTGTARVSTNLLAGGTLCNLGNASFGGTVVTGGTISTTGTGTYDIGTSTNKFGNIYASYMYPINFVTTLTPNANNTYDVGTSSSKWRNTYLSGALSNDANIYSGSNVVATTRLGITTSTPTCQLDLGTSTQLYNQLALYSGGASNWFGFGACNYALNYLTNSNHTFYYGSSSNNAPGIQAMTLTSTGATFSSKYITLINNAVSTDPNLGVRMFTNSFDGITSNGSNQGGLASWSGISFRCTLDSNERHIFDTRTGNTLFLGTLSNTSNLWVGKDLSVAGNTTLSGTVSTGALTTTSITTNNNNINAGTGSVTCGALTPSSLSMSTNPLYIQNGNAGIIYGSNNATGMNVDGPAIYGWNGGVLLTLLIVVILQQLIQI